MKIYCLSYYIFKQSSQIIFQFLCNFLKPISLNIQKIGNENMETIATHLLCEHRQNLGIKLVFLMLTDTIPYFIFHTCSISFWITKKVLHLKYPLLIPHPCCSFFTSPGIVVKQCWAKYINIPYFQRLPQARTQILPKPSPAAD